MTRNIIDISLAMVVCIGIAIFSIFLEIEYCGVMIALTQNLAQGEFYELLFQYGIGINALSYLFFLCWYFLGPRLHQIDSFRFNMRVVWLFSWLVLFILVFIISLTMKSMIDWDATEPYYSYFLLMAYPVACAISYWIITAFFSPAVLKYIPLLSKQIRKGY